jgi:hypothetical protein
VYNSLTGSASIFIATHPERNPHISPEEVADWLFTRNTVIIPGDLIGDRRTAIINLARTFVSTIAVPSAANWETRAVKDKYIPSGKSLTNETAELSDALDSYTHAASRNTKTTPGQAGASSRDPQCEPMERASTYRPSPMPSHGNHATQGPGTIDSHLISPPTIANTTYNDDWLARALDAADISAGHSRDGPLRTSTSAQVRPARCSRDAAAALISPALTPLRRFVQSDAHEMTPHAPTPPTLALTPMRRSVQPDAFETTLPAPTPHAPNSPAPTPPVLTPLHRFVQLGALEMPLLHSYRPY